MARQRLHTVVCTQLAPAETNILQLCAVLCKRLHTSIRDTVASFQLNAFQLCAVLCDRLHTCIRDFATVDEVDVQQLGPAAPCCTQTLIVDVNWCHQPSHEYPSQQRRTRVPKRALFCIVPMSSDQLPQLLRQA